MKTNSTILDNNPCQIDYERMIEIILTKPDMTKAWYEYKTGYRPDSQHDNLLGSRQSPRGKE